MRSKVNLYSIPDCRKEVQLHVACENKINIESYFFSTQDVCFVDAFHRWLKQNVNSSLSELDITLNGENNIIFSIYFDLRKTEAKVKLASDALRRSSHHAA